MSMEFSNLFTILKLEVMNNDDVMIPTYAEINRIDVSKAYLDKSDIKFYDDYKALKEAYENWFPNA